MPLRSFLRQLAVLTLVVALGLWGLHRLPALQFFRSFSGWSLAFFVLLTVVTYCIGSRSVQGKNKFAFINASLGITLAKMVLCVAFVAAYVQLAQPPSRLFLLPFLGIYVIYTIFETAFMMKIGAQKGTEGRRD
jgi:hypothetical protein